jgi:hypothetical protein
VEEFETERDDVYLPTPEEIRAACSAIQAEWTEAERGRRSRGQAGRNRRVLVTSRRFARLLIDRRQWDDRAA